MRNLHRLARLSLVVVGTLAACGGTTEGTNTGNPASGGTGTDGGAPTTGSDAGTPTADAQADAPVMGTDTYPAPHHPLPMLKPLGGPVIKNVKIVTVTYVGEAERDALRAFDDQIVKSAWWTTVTEGLGVNAGSSGGYVELDPTPVANKTLDNDADLKPYIQKLITAGTLPAPDANTLYAIYFPQSTTITLGTDPSCQAFGAYHDSGVFTLQGAMIEVAFAVMPNCGGGRTVSASHEFIEAASDPHPQTQTAWYAYNDAWFGAGGGENADLCQAGASYADPSGNRVAKVWSNVAAAASKDPCVPSDPNAIYYGAAVDTNEMFTMHDPTGGPDYQTEGFISVTAGASKSVPVDVFSQANLPHDLTIVASKGARGGDPNLSTPIATGVTATLSGSTARNGTKLTLTIATTASTPKGDHPFVVRALLSKSEFHSWPVILRVL